MPRNRSDTTNTTPNARSALEAAEQVESTFREFVHNALQTSPAPEASDPPSSTTGKVLPLLRKKQRPARREVTVRMERPGPRRRGSDATPLPAPVGRAGAAAPKVPRPPPLPQRSEATVRRHAHEVASLVPDVRTTPARGPAPREATEDGQMPASELDALLREMGTLLKYGHDAQVQIELDQIRHRYPRDLLLLRRLAEFHLERGDHDRAIEVLFQLSSGLFDRKNVEGMRAALDQVLKLDPGNRRALRLLGLLARRDS